MKLLGCRRDEIYFISTFWEKISSHLDSIDIDIDILLGLLRNLVEIDIFCEISISTRY
jgi:hypothetical protein